MNQLQLRPKTFDEFIGQEKLKITLRTMIQGAQYRKEPLDHLLFYGPPGTGKTSLASIIANETKSRIHYLQGSLIEKKSDILSIFANINENDIVFIDEIHGINKNVEEIIYNAMEDYKIDLIIGPEGNSKVLRMNLKPFTLIGATTKLNLLSQPFKDRFGFHAKLNPYEEYEIVKILEINKEKMRLNVGNDILKMIAGYSRATPRIANHLLKRVCDFSINNIEEKITINTVKETLKHLDLYDFGLTREHIDYLELLNSTFNEKYASLDSISGILNVSKENIIYEIEPYLLYLHLIVKSPRGRKITTAGINYLLKNSPIYKSY
ncbi:Holliday junction branch migration DNA helicase RuvB [Mycoplasmopsis felifaucium]|uniref:Holliday junction branch migration complex subunit RuvB n=1 Tax=Mycoplasmopsis felifaucium TaxID=35768 RepID=A0ABZ2RPF6_9BACT|nr:Holliday junction branch migration DNA helicase RuvB [Mycoplasmopsis felifaucium]